MLANLKHAFSEHGDMDDQDLHIAGYVSSIATTPGWTASNCGSDLRDRAQRPEELLP